MDSLTMKASSGSVLDYHWYPKLNHKKCVKEDRAHAFDQTDQLNK